MMLEDLLQESETLAYIVNRPVDLDAQTEISALRSSNERLEKQLEAAMQKDPERYAPIIMRYQTNIGDNLNRIIELESGSGGGGKPPRRGSGISFGDYEKEIQKIRQYFSEGDRKDVLKTPQDEMYAGVGLRLLESMGKRLDNYEIHVPADYRLELLRRAGRFCEEANVFERLAQGDIQMFRPREQLEGGFIFRVTPSGAKKVFGEGFTRNDSNYPTTHAHVHEFVYGKGDSYISTSTTTQILEKMHFRERKKDGIGLTPERLDEQPRYLYVINPRAWTGIDVMESHETYDQSPLSGQESRPFLQREVATGNQIDQRDVMSVFRVEAKWINDPTGKKKIEWKLVEYQKNERYISSGWELDMGMPN